MESDHEGGARTPSLVSACHLQDPLVGTLAREGRAASAKSSASKAASRLDDVRHAPIAVVPGLISDFGNPPFVYAQQAAFDGASQLRAD